MIDIVIPVHNEQALIGACLRAVLSDSDGLDLRVIVVANGCTDGTAAIARSMGTRIVVVETPTAGKVAALNAAEPHRRGGAVVYLDADTVCTPGTIKALATALDVPYPCLAAPRPVFVRPTGRLARSFARVWRGLPAVADQVIGAGCYSVNAPGRARWREFPPVVADDAFVRSRFAPGERRLTDTGGFLLVLPEGRELVRVTRRWRSGNAGLAESPSAGTGRNLRAVFARPSLWAHLPSFALVTVAGRFVRPARWDRADRGRAVTSATARPRVDALVVTYRNLATIDRCLTSLRSAWADLTVTVVDNASPDGTADHVARAFPEVTLIRNRKNMGFGAAVNQAARRGDGDQLLLVNPDAELDEGALDELLALASRFPGAGLYGGRPVDDEGNLDSSTCLGRPTLWHALAFGSGLSTVPVLDPDSLGGWRRDDVRAVPVLTGGLLLADRSLWRRLRGFDERYVLYGEDVDLCLRAARLGARPMFTPAAGYRHQGGGSSTPEGRTVGILRGKATLYTVHLPPLRAKIARSALVAGVGLRAAGERFGRGAGVWSAAWRRRQDWRTGWS